MFHHLLCFQAYEDRVGRFGTAQATVIVQVDDVNESPSFLSNHYTAVVSEGVDEGEPLFSGIVAIDLDEVNSAIQ